MIIAGKIRCFLIAVFLLSCFEARVVPYEMNVLVWRPSSGTLGSSVRLRTLAGHPPRPATITLTGWDGVSRGAERGGSHSQACWEPEQNGQLPWPASIFSTILSLQPPVSRPMYTAGQGRKDTQTSPCTYPHNPARQARQQGLHRVGLSGTAQTSGRAEFQSFSAFL